MRLIRLLKNDLVKESAGWVQQQIITPDQARQICQLYGADYDNPTGHSKGYLVLISLGYLFIGLALITLIGANWESIPRAVRMAGLILTTLTLHLIGLYQFHRRNEDAAVGLFFLGSISYGAAIMLIAQVYHIGEHYPDGILWWAIGVLPMAVLLKSRLLMMLTTTLAYIWFFTESSLHYFPMLFPVFLVIMGWQIFKYYESRPLFLSLAAGTALFFEYCLSWQLGGFRRFDVEIENMLLGFGIFVFYQGLAKWLYQNTRPVLKDYGTILGIWVLRFFILTLFILSFKEPWQEIFRSDFQIPGFILGINFFFCVCAVGLSYKADKKPGVTVLVSILVFLVCAALLYLKADEKDVYMAVFDNLILVSSGVWLIVQGIRQSVSHYFFIGVITTLLTGLCRYIDLVGDYIGAAILFAVFAAILLSTAKFWRHFHQGKGGAHDAA